VLKSFYDLRNEFVTLSKVKEQDGAEIRNIKWAQNLVSSVYIMHLYELNIHLQGKGRLLMSMSKSMVLFTTCMFISDTGKWCKFGIFRKIVLQ
jgi:hypothetical protein